MTLIAKDKNEQIKTLVKDIFGDALNDYKETLSKSAGNPVKDAIAENVVRKNSDMSNEERSDRGARFIRCLAYSKGNAEKAVRFAQDDLKDREMAKMIGDAVEKSQLNGDLTAGGILVPEILASDIIMPLRARTAIRRAQPTVISTPNGNITLPKITTGASAGYIDEATAQNATSQTYGSRNSSWKKLRANIAVSNELIATSALNSEAIIRQDLQEAMMTREDQAFIRDDGTESKPLGIRYFAGNTVASTGTGATAVEANFTDLFEQVEGSNIMWTRPAMFMSTRSKNYLRKLRDANGNLIYPEIGRAANPTIYDVPVFLTNNIPNNLGTSSDESEIYLANMSDIIIFDTTTLEVVISNEATYTDLSGTSRSAWDREETLIKTIARHDLNVRHEEAVAVMTGVKYGA